MKLNGKKRTIKIRTRHPSMPAKKEGIRFLYPLKVEHPPSHAEVRVDCLGGLSKLGSFIRCGACKREEKIVVPGGIHRRLKIRNPGGRVFRRLFSNPTTLGRPSKASPVT